MSRPAFSSRELAFSGLFGAVGLLLPGLFHLLHLGQVFMPMYLPLVALGFFVGPLPAALTALVVPLLSGLLTGMPPFYPPVAPAMSLELAAMAALIALAHGRWPRLPALAVLLPVLLFGRALNFATLYLAARLVDLPAQYVAGLSLLSGWPGVLLMLVVVPALARAAEPRAPHDSPSEESR